MGPLWGCHSVLILGKRKRQQALGLDLLCCWGSGEASLVRWRPLRPGGWVSWAAGVSGARKRAAEVIGRAPPCTPPAPSGTCWSKRFPLPGPLALSSPDVLWVSNSPLFSREPRVSKPLHPPRMRVLVSAGGFGSPLKPDRQGSQNTRSAQTQPRARCVPTPSGTTTTCSPAPSASGPRLP